MTSSRKRSAAKRSSKSRSPSARTTARRRSTSKTEKLGPQKYEGPTGRVASDPVSDRPQKGKKAAAARRTKADTSSSSADAPLPESLPNKE